MKNLSGKYRKNFSGDLEYFSFLPSKLPLEYEINIDNDMLKILIKANNSISVLESISKTIPNTNLFTAMYIRKETLLSSQIEGTQATLEDIFDPMISENSNRDVTDVINYIAATEYAIKRLKTLPLCNRLLNETHSVLLKNVRGSDKNPGEFRRSQNWIGAKGSTLKTASFIPPHPDNMIDAMNNLEKYINEDDEIDNLIKIALIHYQFETIHPYLDGNGRIGRLLITLFLLEKKILTTPSLYISYFLKKNRIEYYDRMTEVRNKGNYEQWIKFFLNALNESAQDAIKTIETLNNLRYKNISIIEKMGRMSHNAMHFFSFLESNPIIDIGKTAKAIGLSFNTVSSIIKKFISFGILSQTENASRNRTFIYKEYLDILKEGT